MQPHEWRSVQWCTGKWHLFGGNCEKTIYMIFGLWSLGLNCIKPILSYILFKTKHFVIFEWHYKRPHGYIHHEFLRKTHGYLHHEFYKKSHGYIHHEFYRVDYTILIHSEKVMRFFSTFPVQELKLSITRDTAKILDLLSRGRALSPYDSSFPREEMRQDLSEGGFNHTS